LRLGRDAVALVDRRDAGCVEGLHGSAHSGDDLGVGHRRKHREQRHPGHRRDVVDRGNALGEVEVAKDARRLPPVVGENLDSFGRSRAASDAGQPEGGSVGNGDPGRDQNRRLDVDGVVRRHPVQVVARRPPTVGQEPRHAVDVRLLDQRVGDDPLSRLAGLAFAPQHDERVLDKPEALERGLEEPEADDVHVWMSIDEARDDRATAEVHLARAAAGRPSDLVTTPDGRDAAILDGHRLHDRVAGIDSVDASMVGHQVDHSAPIPFLSSNSEPGRLGY